MAQQAAHYHTLADPAQKEADAAQLDNVRARCQRAAIAFREMAERLSRIDGARNLRTPASPFYYGPKPEVKAAE